MKLKISLSDVWVAEIADRPGGLAVKLAALSAAGANLDFVIARRQPDKPGRGVVFVTPIAGGKQVRAAAAVGFVKSKALRSVRVESGNKRGLGAALTGAVAMAGVNLRGLSAGVVGKNAVCYLAFDSAADAAKAAKAIKKL